MRFFQAPAAVLGLVTVTLLSPVVAKPYPAPTPTARIEEPRDLQNASQIEKRQCAGTPCGYYKQLCCTGGQICTTNANNEAVCAAGGGQVSNGWEFFTSTYLATDLVTKTAVYSSFVGAPNPHATGNCQSEWDSPCGPGLCCGVGYYCATIGTCKLNGGSTGGIIGTLTPSAPLRPTSSTLIIITATGTPTATVPFSTPIPTGVNGTLLPVEDNSGGLSGGAIAGIVIGVLLGLLLLLLLCFYCCAKSLFDTILACFGIGKKRRHTHEETYIEEHHHSSGVAASGGGRRWYGQAPSRQSRSKKSGGGMGGLLGTGAALGGLALALGLKRKHDRKEEDKTTTYTGSSAYYSDYTSASSASSSDRRSRPTRHSSRR